MKAYLGAKTEAAKNTIFNFPALVKAWPGKALESTKDTLKATDWPATIVHFIGWTVRQSMQGVLFGMGAFSLLTQVVVWDVLSKRDLGDGPIPTDDIYGVLASGFGMNVIFAGAGILACLIINSSKLRLYRLDRFESPDKEFSLIVREAVERLNQKKPV